MILTHRKFYFNLNEERRLLRESQESKSQSAAKKLVMQKLGYNEQQADEFVRMKLRNDLPALRKSGPAKFTLAATRMFLDRQLNNANTISSLNTAIDYAANEKHYNEFDRDLNGVSAQELIKMMQPEIDADLQKSQDEINNTQYTRNANYGIVRIDSFNQSQQYGQYTSWCITHYRNMWDRYARITGIKCLYLRLLPQTPFYLSIIEERKLHHLPFIHDLRKCLKRQASHMLDMERDHVYMISDILLQSIRYITW